MLKLREDRNRDPNQQASMFLMLLALLTGTANAITWPAFPAYLVQVNQLIHLPAVLLTQQVANTLTLFLSTFCKSPRVNLLVSTIFAITGSVILAIWPTLVGIYVHQVLIGIYAALNGPSAEFATRKVAKNSVSAGGWRNAARALTMSLAYLIGGLFDLRTVAVVVTAIYAVSFAITLYLLLLPLNLEEEEAKKEKKFPNGASQIPRIIFWGILCGGFFATIGQTVTNQVIASTFSPQMTGVILGVSALISAALQGFLSQAVKNRGSLNPIIIFCSRCALLGVTLILLTEAEWWILAFVWAFVTAGPTFQKHVMHQIAAYAGAKWTTLTNSLAGLFTSLILAITIIQSYWPLFIPSTLAISLTLLLWKHHKVK